MSQERNIEQPLPQFPVPPPSVDALEELADDDIMEVDGQATSSVAAPPPPDSLDVFDRIPMRTVMGVPTLVSKAAPVIQTKQEEPEVEIDDASIEVFERAAARLDDLMPIDVPGEAPVSSIAMTMKVQNDPRPAPEPAETVIVEERSEPIVDRTLRLARADVFTAANILAAIDGPESQHVPPAPTTSPVLPSSVPTMMGGMQSPLAPNGPASQVPTMMGGVSPVPPSVRAHSAPPPQSANANGFRPQQSSIAPVAVDVARGAPITLPAPARVPVITPPVPRKAESNGMLPIAVAAALFLGVGGVIAGFAIGSSGSSKTQASTTTTNEARLAHTPHTPVVEGANAATIDNTPRTAPARDTSLPSEVDVSSLPTASTATHAATTPVAATPVAGAGKEKAQEKPATSSSSSSSSQLAKLKEKTDKKDEKTAAAPAETAPPAAPPPVAAPVAPPPTTGVVRVPIDERYITIMVDGGYRKPVNGTVVLSCGRHSIRIGMSSAQDVNVPCGGTVSVQ